MKSRPKPSEHVGTHVVFLDTAFVVPFIIRS